ncbi:MAG: type II toxin-antitoxin system Phd/YefM family antitoxin [Nitrospiraceae bacterium]|nr:type II toxin-antitoxin system Phd/YefM family antitoxin [Nitrospiraceae bacterium]
MVKKLSLTRARRDFSELLGRVHSKKDTVIVEQDGKPVVAMIDFERYQSLTSKRERLFRVVDRLWDKNRGKSARQAARDASEAVAEIKTIIRKSRRRSA